jgi:hypothetical protein
MAINRVLLMLLTSAIILLVGVTGQARASTVDCLVATGIRAPTGHVDMWADIWKSDSAYQKYVTVITRGYYEEDGRCYPLQNGFCVFAIPYLDRPATACTLYYYQTAHQGSASLRVNYMYEIAGSWPPSDTALFWYAWNDTVVVATDSTHTNNNNWYVVPLTSQGRQAISDIGYTNGGGALCTGWTDHDFVDGDYTDVAGAGSGYAPYIRVVY